MLLVMLAEEVLPVVSYSGDGLVFRVRTPEAAPQGGSCSGSRRVPCQ